jgi:hypothetical protein
MHSVVNLHEYYLMCYCLQAQFERGYGLEAAVAEQEALKEAVRRRDADIARLTRAAGEQLDA